MISPGNRNQSLEGLLPALVCLLWLTYRDAIESQCAKGMSLICSYPRYIDYALQPLPCSHFRLSPRCSDATIIIFFINECVSVFLLFGVMMGNKVDQ